MLGNGMAAAQEAYVNIESDVLTFYYDYSRSHRSGKSYSVTDVDEYGMPAWGTDTRQNVVTISFDNSFRKYLPKSTKNWFHYFGSLKSIIAIQNLNTSQVTDMSYMFKGCEALTALDLSSLDTRNVQNFRCTFTNCRNLTTLNLKGWNTEKATDMYQMFAQCNKLTTLDLSSFSLPNIENMDMMFIECWNLIALTLTLNEANKLTQSEYMFYGCDNLCRIYTASDWNTPALSKSEGMFSFCPKLVGKDGTAYDASHTDKDYAHLDNGSSNPGYLSLAQLEAYVICNNDSISFYYDYFKNLRDGELYPIPNNIQEYPAWGYYYKSEAKVVVFDQSFADYRPKVTCSWFYNCSLLEDIYGLEFLNTSEVTDMSQMFYGCSSLTSLNLSTFDTRKVTNMQGMFCNSKGLKTVNISSFDTNNVTDMSNMFYGCEALTSLNVKNFKTSKVIYMGGMFGICRSISKLDLSSFDTQNVVDMQSMFKSCNKLSNLSIESFKTGKVASMEDMFSTCRSLSTLNLSHFDTGNVTNMRSMFWGCTKLNSLDISNFNTSKVTDMGLMFCACPNFETLKLTSFDTRNVKDMVRMFDGCNDLTILDLSSFNTSKVTSMASMFFNCIMLKTIYVGPGWNTDNVVESDNMFTYCKNLVGEKGTTYDWDYTNQFYARVDGGPKLPGYFTLKLLMGDVNLDGSIDVRDMSAILEAILKGTTALLPSSADLTADQMVDVRDMSAILNIILGKVP
jgi:surface protein